MEPVPAGHAKQMDEVVEAGYLQRRAWRSSDGSKK
jgi:hypothetical protein